MFDFCRSLHGFKEIIPNTLPYWMFSLSLSTWWGLKFDPPNIRTSSASLVYHADNSTITVQ